MCGRCGHQFHRKECEACRFDEPPHPPCAEGIDPGVFACQLLSQISLDLRNFMSFVAPLIEHQRAEMESRTKIHRL
jgi:hypothetical protein